jgi:hypothetical protein
MYTLDPATRLPACHTAGWLEHMALMIIHEHACIRLQAHPTRRHTHIHNNYVPFRLTMIIEYIYIYIYIYIYNHIDTDAYICV